MNRFAIIKQSTDMRAPQTEIVFTRSRKKAASAALTVDRMTHADPEAERNWHHTLTRVFSLPPGWRKPTEMMLWERARARSSYTYPRNAKDELASEICRVGTRLGAADFVGKVADA